MRNRLLIHALVSNAVRMCQAVLFLVVLAPGPARAISLPNEFAREFLIAGTNSIALSEALNNVPEEQRPAVRFLLHNMPDADLMNLPASILVENVKLAYQAVEEVPWGKQIPNDIFLNDILPYACLNEARDAWRKRLHDLCRPLVRDCSTPSEAAQRLNAKLFTLVDVRYSTARKKPDQSPLETMHSGLATCTGLSVLLVDACRAVGVPARVAGTPLWVNMRGNHTWVEIWDSAWHFTGAAEPDPHGLDRGWFVHDASQALKDVPRHAIYASSFKKTGLSFPLVWAPGIDWVQAVNVTDRYTPRTPAPTPGQVRLLVTVLDSPGGKRVAADVAVRELTNTTVLFQGESRDESADLNDLLAISLPRGHRYRIDASHGSEAAHAEFRAGTNDQQVVVLCLNNLPQLLKASMACYLPPHAAPLSAALRTDLHQAFTEFFKAPSSQQSTWHFPDRLNQTLGSQGSAVRQIAWEAYRSAPIHDDLRRDYDTHQVRFETHLSPYTIKTVGERPANGWPLFIAMHGGGGVAKAVNDSQWRVMQHYYRDHPELGGYLYLALRAPDDTWNGFYTDYTYPLVDNLIRQFLLFADVDPNKVFLMGYSHGGYGAFAIGPKMPDHFAAIHASAAAPTDGETTAKTLRNTLFSYMIGEKDSMYGRLERCRKFNEAVQQLRGARTDIYPVVMQYIPGNGHTGLPDRDKIVEMYPAIRNPVPRELTWLMTDSVITDFFWLDVPHPAKGQEIDATCQNNFLHVSTTNVLSASVLLDGRLVDFSRPIGLECNGTTTYREVKPSLLTLCKTLQQRGDPELAFTAELPLLLGQPASPSVTGGTQDKEHEKGF